MLNHVGKAKYVRKGHNVSAHPDQGVCQGRAHNRAHAGCTGRERPQKGGQDDTPALSYKEPINQYGQFLLKRGKGLSCDLLKQFLGCRYLKRTQTVSVRRSYRFRSLRPHVLKVL